MTKKEKRGNMARALDRGLNKAQSGKDLSVPTRCVCRDSNRNAVDFFGKGVVR